MSDSNIELRIENLTRKLQLSANSVERAEIAEKIKNLREDLKRSKTPAVEPQVTTHIDAPVIADRGTASNLKLERGQIMNSGNLFSTEI